MKLLILDGNSVINRAYFGVKPLTTRDGLYTHAIFGFLNILERMQKEEQPDAVAVAFDLHGPTFRHLRYDGYKATRHGMPEELAQQMPVMKQVLRAMSIPIYECQGWEADDVIGTVGRICSNNAWQCVIVTGDRDSLQLIDDNVNVKLVISKPGQTNATLYDRAQFEAEYGFEPKKLIDLKALMGDASDNIPGVAGVGPKTAKELLLKFGSLDGVYANLDNPSVRPKLREKLEAGKDNAYLSYELATIIPEAPIDFAPEDALLQPYHKQELYQLFQRLEFVKLIDKYGLRSAAVEAPKVSKAERLPKAESVPDDLDACALYFAPDGSLGIAWEGGVCALTPMEAQMNPLCLAPETKLILHDSKSALHRLAELGLDGREVAFDTALAAYDLNPSQSDYPVSKLATTFLGMTVEDGDAAACAEAVWLLHQPLAQELDRCGMEQLYKEIELPLCRVLYKMERRGIAIDREQLAAFGKMLSGHIADCEALIYSYSGASFNINSPKQLGEVLFDQLGLPPVKKTKTGYATNADVLEKLKNKHPIIPAIVDYRMLTKLKSTYADGLMKEIREDGRIHTTLQNLVTATGRLSSTEPNLQNIPVRTDLGAEIRKMFVPKPGCVLVDADYSQIELRLMAHFSGDHALVEAFRTGQDVHARTASEIFDVPLDEVDSTLRSRAKAVNFGLIYGISGFGLAKNTGVSRQEAQEFINRYFAKYPGVKGFMDSAAEDGRHNGYALTLMGRRRYLPELKSDKAVVREFGKRAAMNTPVQGTAADIIKLAMVRVDEALRREGLKSRLILQVHDELLLECPPEEVEKAGKLLKDAMEHVIELRVPLLAEVHQGMNWAEAK